MFTYQDDNTKIRQTMGMNRRFEKLPKRTNGHKETAYLLQFI